MDRWARIQFERVGQGGDVVMVFEAEEYSVFIFSILSSYQNISSIE